MFFFFVFLCVRVRVCVLTASTQNGARFACMHLSWQRRNFLALVSISLSLITYYYVTQCCFLCSMRAWFVPNQFKVEVCAVLCIFIVIFIIIGFCLNAVLMDFVAKYVKLPKHKMGVELIDYTIK